MENPTFMERLLQVTTLIVLLWFAMLMLDQRFLGGHVHRAWNGVQWRLNINGLEVLDNETTLELVEDLDGFGGLALMGGMLG
ncbi:hypothetical protein CLAFUW4_09883 [Fulvia fulva]|uniref:uncharacterized protein n=1 Tax=Passalora fulva TaxID=5499 RepID=UPI00285256DF|nr:uncharacterized protein CLAFUR5_20285 [Fulvia fulva]KAK4615302.1 hypothetical protein CLAFUR4_09888 [Fulvia fulva]KAK4617367.1 hypothetical protein CLAFUR0_09882 [Fulvia fulva]WMI39035.1 hypothetical protein CLAFUR5_20285 [Fulvia fulva]WPV19474.1 hypothetical protein CLAFUW4_09883 [Fulvia fulva]WPV34568.1 hypothetical protein CLAFUW7_09885 [Fulvia fulva]